MFKQFTPESPLETAQLVYGGFYAPMIAEYLRYFSPEDLLVIQHAELQSDPTGVVQKAARHIGA